MHGAKDPRNTKPWNYVNIEPYKEPYKHKAMEPYKISYPSGLSRGLRAGNMTPIAAS